MKNLFWIMVLFMSSFSAKATVESYDGVQSLGGVSSVSDTILIGPNAIIDIPVGQSWNIFSTTVFIHPNAQLSGNGALYFRDPSLTALGSLPLLIDGGGVNIDVNVIFENPQNMILSQIIAPASTGWSAAEGAGEDDLYFGRDFQFNDTYDGITPIATVSDNHIILGNLNLIFDENATVSGFTEDAYIVTNGSGVVIKQGLNGTFTFPIGFTETTGGIGYSPAELSDIGAATFEVSVADFANSANSCSISAPEEGVDQIWFIETSSGSATSATLYLQHNTGSNGSAYDASASQFISRCIGTAPNVAGGETSLTEWDFVGNSSCSVESGVGTLTTGSNVANSTVLSRSGITDFDQFQFFTKSVCDITPLPVTFGEIDVRTEDCHVNLTWETLTETNNSHFEIQRSMDGVSFETIGTIEGSGTTTSTQYYSYIDQPGNGDWYFRIKQVDFDGSSEVTQIFAVNMNCSEFESILFPNPADTQTTVRFMANSSEVTIRLYSIIGQLEFVDEIEVEQGEVVDYSFNFPSLASGFYVVTLEHGDTVESHRLVIQ